MSKQVYTVGRPKVGQWKFIKLILHFNILEVQLLDGEVQVLDIKVEDFTYSKNLRFSTVQTCKLTWTSRFEPCKLRFKSLDSIIAFQNVISVNLDLDF